MLSRANLYNKLKPRAAKFHAIGNTTRLSVLYIVAREPMEFGRLVSRLKIPPSLLSHHLKLLVAAGLVTKTKFGKLATYYLAEDSIKEMRTLLRKFLDLNHRNERNF